ncbi:MAG TPA: DNA polymerase III subunit beta [Fermentimonas caenicola]|jgi:DNA polymerase-3 subunit beta|uniref:Beta sliding clamp n=1 Tax=Fermentimonas caenicola TaxID=1562970 RepID=A0A098C0I4_9BACT|nr:MULTISPECIES: DNA polymerase III subunit beta [Lascolabacillus]MBP6175009.1 DNA polymerase III subunit beta [Fermentimonas sp.]MDI9626316.1 DNA polymerase III subunit beta [Bacteroidota bacterium]TAH61909.1 MAG: DNA polymerase III subunit beta [Fermentimonas caenicola]MBP6196237.1 DNA polymerase III subunit beta [Fermentimonas sp.]MBP7103582.1 DNA polymerase III subunit beta [Fermentimonas sp.]
MKFIASSATMLNHLQAISRVINSKSTLPILDCFKLELKGNKLTLTAADSETRLETWIEVNNAEGEGSLAINAKNLLDPLRELPDQPLTFDINDETLEVFIYYHNGKYNFVGLKGDEYPEPKPLKEETSMSLTIEADMLMSGINRTVFATADDELRPVMNGIYFDITSDNLTFVASDGHKLVRVTTTEAKGEGRSSFILPKKPANLLKALLPKETGTVTINFDENNAYITMSDYKMICRFVEGRYPNYNSVIPQNNSNTVTLDRLTLLNALKRVSVFSNPSIGLVKLQLSEEKIVITAQDIDFLTAAEETIVCSYTGNVMNIGFKAAFLIEILDNIPSSDVRIELSDPSRAGLILPVEQETNEDMLTLLMPMMLND